MRAVISLGTNTVRLLIACPTASGGLEPVEERQTGTRLGERLADTGTLSPDAVGRTLRVAADYATVARERGALACAIATSAVRRADDREAFAARFRNETGVVLEILDGVREAAASYRGATAGKTFGDARIAVLDIGGGSTECAVGRGGTLEGSTSIEIGSVRLADRFPDLLGNAPPPRARSAAAVARAEIRERLAPLAALGPIDTLVCVAGTPLTLAAVAWSSHVDAVSGRRLPLATIEATVERLLGLELAERRELPGMLPQRADVLPGGGLILEAACDRLGVGEALLERNDLLLGFLLSTPAATHRPAPP